MATEKVYVVCEEIMDDVVGTETRVVGVTRSLDKARELMYECYDEKWNEFLSNYCNTDDLIYEETETRIYAHSKYEGCFVDIIISEERVMD